VRDKRKKSNEGDVESKTTVEKKEIGLEGRPKKEGKHGARELYLKFGGNDLSKTKNGKREVPKKKEE